MKLKNILPIFALFFLGFAQTSQAQIEVKINPIGALFSAPDLGVEYIVNESFGVELNLAFNFNKFTVDGTEFRNTGFGTRLSGKYYFSPDDGGDRWYAGVYTKFRRGNGSADNSTDEVTSTRLAVGILFGHKWVTKHNLVFEINVGFGRAFISKWEYSDGEEVNTNDIPLLNWDVVGTFAVGYRFGDN